MLIQLSINSYLNTKFKEINFLLLLEALLGVVVVVVLRVFLASISALLGLPLLALTISVGSGSGSGSDSGSDISTP